MVGGASGATVMSPVAVPISSGPAFPQNRDNRFGPDPQYSAQKAIDGNPATFCCLLDDTPSGNASGTIPAGGDAPVTGHVIFDLGAPRVVLGVRLTGRKDAGNVNPREVDFFYFADDDPARHAPADDLENDSGIKALVRKHAIKPLAPGACEAVYWDGVVARYVGMRVNSSYESRQVHFNFQLGEVEFFVGSKTPRLPPGSRLPPLYVKKGALAETMLATRDAYRSVFADEAEDAPAASIPDPTGALWDRLRTDFPSGQHRLLDYILADWFGSNGWFGSPGSTRLEEATIVRALAEVKADGQGLRGELDELRRTAVPANDPRWLDLAARSAELALVLEEMQCLRAAVEHLARSFPQRYPGEKFLRALERLQTLGVEACSTPGRAPGPTIEEIRQELETLKRHALVAENPLLAGGRILFAKRFTFSPGWYYADFLHRGRRFGGNLCVLSLSDGKVTELVPELNGGIFDRYDLSFDGRRIVFGYRAAPGKGFRLYEVGVDGAELRQLTFDPADGKERIDQVDDYHPCYLPDGGICFASTRCERGVLCDQGDTLHVNVLYRMDADGRNMQVLSQNALSESTPSVMNDGRILYTRWEYVDKGVIAVQALWAMRPDGTGAAEVYGNDIENPPVLIHARAIPGSNNRFVATGTLHHPFAVGPIARIDTTRDVRTHEPIHWLTPETNLSVQEPGTFPRGESFTHLRNGRWVPDNQGPLYCDPYPLADPETGAGAGKFFLVACNPDRPWHDAAAYGLYLLDDFGNRVLIHRDPAISCWQPMPLQPRPRPPIWSSGTVRSGAEGNEATVVLQDVYAGLEGVRPGTIKYLRILEQVARPWSAHRLWPNDSAFGQHAPISLNSHIHVKILHGVVPVHEDGSAHFTAPADRNLFFQALDENYMEVQRMRTFVNFQPGESRSCTGCHLYRPTAPKNKPLLALRHGPDRPQPQPGDAGPRALHYPTDVQPILDKHCVSCHNVKKADGELDLSGEMTDFFCRSYENLMNRKLLAYVQEFYGPQPDAQKTNVVPLPARTLGSHASRLIAILQQGHYEVDLSRAEMVRLITWVDANGPYYGTYFGRRNRIYQGHPNFRPNP